MSYNGQFTETCMRETRSIASLQQYIRFRQGLLRVPINNIHNHLILLQLGQIIKQDIMFFRVG
jgi:hypothetical protein